MNDENEVERVARPKRKRVTKKQQKGKTKVTEEESEMLSE